ncbi:MAG: 3-phosphoshikimate 1-carboxyvinyltransferase [Deltaproteobacteria bacterium]|nr:3-phosphoshikimate 1-carboxyvinyltransferase [Deltaproteobacteria bacterium]
MREGAETYEVRPLQRPPDCSIHVPGSKSITNRALLIAALADGVSTLDGGLYSDDTTYMAESWRRLGIRVEEDVAACRFRVYGCSGAIPASSAELFAGNAGTAMRFLVAALCLGHGHFRIDGTPRMRERPIQDLADALIQLGAKMRCLSPGGCPPVEVDAGGLAGGAATIDAAKSSQFLSAVLQVAPYAQRTVQLQVSGRLVAAPYIDMTIAVMSAFGVEVQRQGYEHFDIAPQRYQARDYRIEPDASSAHYFFAAAALSGGRVRIDGLGKQSLQGDVRFADVLEAMGAEVARGDDFLEVRGRGSLKGIDVDMNAISDTAPTLAAIAPFARSRVRIRNVAHLRLQESDRLKAVATELGRLGVAVTQHDDGLTIEPSAVHAATIETYDDHRIAMSFALVGLCTAGIRIRDPQCVRKTFPDYFARLEELRR